MKDMRKDFFRYISLGVLGMLGSAGTILADAFFVSDRLGADGLAAMNLAMCMFGLMNGTGLLFGIGGATRYTILKARGRQEEADSVFSLAFFAALAVGLTYGLAGLLFSDKMSYLLGADADTFAMCNRYLKTILCFAPAFVLNHLLIAFVRNDSDPGLAMRAMMTGSIANIFLDYLFMYPLNMGIFGAAAATGLAALLGISVSSLHFFSDRNNLRFVKFTLSAGNVARVASAGVSAFVTEFSSGAVLVVFNLLILKAAGNVGVAAYGIVANLALMILAVMNGIAQGIQPLVSTKYGKGDRTAAGRLYRAGTKLAFVIGLGVFFSARVFAPQLVRFFNSARDPVLRTMAEKGMGLYFIGFLFVGRNYLTAACFSATQQAKRAFAIAVFRGLAGITAIVCLLAYLWGMTGIWLAFPAAELAAVAVCKVMEKRHGM